MGGPALFSGSTYQSRVIAFIEAHVLAQSRLGWLEPLNDTPIAVWAETGGPGDDIRIEFVAAPHAEAQAKHGLTAGEKLREVATAVATKSVRDQSPVIIVVDETASLPVRRAVAHDLDNIRASRTDTLSEQTKALRSAGVDENVLSRLRIVQCDVDRPFDSETKLAMDKLERVLVDSKQAKAAWHILDADAAEISARPGRRDRAYLEQLLRGAGLKLKAVGEAAAWHEQLDFSRTLLRRRHFTAALKHLDELDKQLSGVHADGGVWYRIHTQRAMAFYFLQRNDESERSALRALESRTEGVEALMFLTRVAIERDAPDDAKRYAQRAVNSDADSPVAWIAMADAWVAAGEAEPQPPAGVASSFDYRSELVVLALRRKDWKQVLDRSAALLEDEHRPPEVLLMRAQTLYTVAELGSREASQHYRDMLRLGREVIEEVDDPSNELTKKGLMICVTAKANLDELDELDVDIAALARDYPNDAEALSLIVPFKVQHGQNPEALRLLLHPVVDGNPLLLAMRAELRAIAGEGTTARADLAAAVGQLDSEDDSEEARIRCALAACQLEDSDLAERVLGSLSTEHPGGLVLIARARIALARGKYDEAEALFDSVAKRKPSSRTDLVVVLATEFLTRGIPDRAVRLFDDLGAALPTRAVAMHVQALIETHDFERAAALVERALAEVPTPGWALGRAAQLALWQADLTKAVEYLEALVKREESTVDGRIQLVHCLLQLDRAAAAQEHLDVLASDASLTTRQQTMTAELLNVAGRAEESVRVAFRAARRAPDDPDIQRSFAVLTLTSGIEWPTPIDVGPNTHVLLQNDTGGTREYTIVDDEIVDSARNRITVVEAQARGLVGLRLGEAQVDHAGAGYLEERWTVRAITPAAIHAAHEVLRRFHELFAGQPLLARVFQFSDGRINEFLPFIQSMEENRRHVTDILALYRDQVLPLAVVAKWLDTSIGDLVEQLPHEQLVPGLYVEWVDTAGQSASEVAARDAKQIVLTRSGLTTAQKLGLLEAISATYQLSAPTSLEQEVRDDLKRAEREVKAGRKRMVPQLVVGFALREIPAGDEGLVRQRDAVRALLDWIHKHVDLRARPLTTVGPKGSAQEKARKELGESSYDALALCENTGAVLYADDLGLRRFGLAGTKPESFSTISMLSALAGRNLISRAERDERKLELARARYLTIRPTPELLALSLKSNLTEAERERVFDLFSVPMISLREAARVGAWTIRRVAEFPIRTRTTAEVANRILRAMSKAFRPPMYAVALFNEAKGPLQLLPDDLDEVKKRCDEAIAKAFQLKA